MGTTSTSLITPLSMNMGSHYIPSSPGGQTHRVASFWGPHRVPCPCQLGTPQCPLSLLCPPISTGSAVSPVPIPVPSAFPVPVKSPSMLCPHFIFILPLTVSLSWQSLCR